MKRFFLALTVPLLLLSCNSAQDKSAPAAPGTQMVRAKGKGDMILLTDRPVNLETPLHYFLQDFTPNDVFFVRWHLSQLPDSVNPDTFRLRVNGNVQHELALSLADLRSRFQPVTLPALVQCAGNARSFFDPRVPGGQWKNGAMGNAKWTGVRLKDILEMAAPRSGSIQVAFNGLDQPPLPTVPDFIKTLDIAHAMDGEVMVAWEMNGKPLPLLNGYPLKLVVPGWYATYWVGMLSEIKVYSDTFQGFWMKKAYLVPKNVVNGNENHDSLPTDLVPIGKMDVRSVFVAPEPDSVLHAGKTVEINGLAMDGGDGIVKVELSTDNGATWQSASLDPSLGKYAWRRWRYRWTPSRAGEYKLKVKAVNSKGDTQPDHQWNRSGYMRNEIESLTLKVVS